MTMQPSRLLQLASVISALIILVLDSRTPLGFAHGDLYLFSILLAVLSGSRNFLIGMTITCVTLTALGIFISQPGLDIRYYGINRVLSAVELVVVSALCVYIMGRFRNLANRHEALRKLTPSAEDPLSPFQHSGQFQLFADAIPQIVWTADPDGIIDYVNLSLVRYTGTERESVIPGSRWLSVVAAEDRDRSNTAWVEGIRSGELFELECRLKRADGAWRWHLLKSAPVRDVSGQIVKWCGVAIDIHEIKVYIERFEYVTSVSVDAVSDWDVENMTIWWSPGITRLFGHDRDEMMRNPHAWTQHLHPDDREHIRKTLYESFVSDTNQLNLRYRFIRKDGSVAQVEENAFIVRNSEGKALRMIGGMTDVTQRRSLEEQLSHSQRMQSIGQLTGGIAHDFNNLLTVIQGNTELLAEQLAGNDALTGLTAMISHASRRAAELVQRLLAFARRQPLDPHPTDVAGLVQNMQTLIRRTLPERIEFEVVAQNDLPPAMIDPPQLESALLNLCLNARDAMTGHGKLLLELTHVELDRAYCDQHPGVNVSAYVMVAVTDTGSGMSKEIQQKVFDPFFSTKPAGEGSGLGLSMAYGFVKQSGGHIAIYSEPGVGTAVRMYLPVSRDQDLTQSQRTAELVASFQPGAKPAGRSRRVLLVEDEEMVRRYAEKQFKALGYEVLVADSPQHALDLLDKHKPVHILFTDGIMPGGLNGPELASAAVKVQPDLKVLYTSGYSENAISHQGRLAQGTHLLSKPWRRDDLARKLKELEGTD